MAQDADSSSFPRWPWGALEKRQLNRKFRASLHALLREIERAYDEGERPDDGTLARLAETIGDAAATLDECAANCHALAATLRTLATGAELMPGQAMPASRLAGAIGKDVVLTRTTIDELKGKTLSLERLNDNNAIVRLEEDYWGTPVDRLLVLDGEDEGADGSGSDGGEPVLSVSPKAATLLKRLEAGQFSAPLVMWSCGHADIVRMEYSPEGLREFVPVSALPERLAAFMDKARKSNPQTDLEFRDGPAALPDGCTFVFRLKRGELSNAIQFLTMAGRQGRLDASFPDTAEKGAIHLQNSSVTQVQYGEAQGVEALARMLIRNEVSAAFVDGAAPQGPPLTLSTDQLLIEAAVRADEIAGEETAPPPASG